MNNSELKIYYAAACWGMSGSTTASACGCGITAEWAGNIGGSGTINVSSCIMGGCLGGSLSCGKLMNGWNIL